MLTIITGSIDSGKTAKLISLYRMKKTGGGIALPKYYVNGQCAGQRIVRLSTGDSMIFSLKDPFIPDGFQARFRYSNYSFSTEGFLFAKHVADEIMKDHISCVFWDEIGPLELNKKGFYSILCGFLADRKDLCTVVRDSCLQGFLRLFNITDYTLLYGDLHKGPCD